MWYYKSMKEKMSRKSFIVIFILLFVVVVVCALVGYINRDKEMSDNTHTYIVPVSKYIIVDGTMVTDVMIEEKKMVLDAVDDIILNKEDVIGKCVKRNVKVDEGSVFKTSDLEECSNEN